MLLPRLATAAIILFSASSFAADAPRKIDFTSPLLDESNKPIQECVKASVADSTKCDQLADVTLGKLAMRALNMHFQDENVLGDEQVHRGALALSIFNNPESALTTDDIALVKKLIAKMGISTIVVYRAWRELDPASVPAVAVKP